MAIRPINTPKVRTRKAPEPAEEVGYGRPPKHSRFKPGQSGNPKGRPKGAKSQKTIFQEALDARIEYLEQGKRQSATRRELVVLKLVEKALKGDARAIATLLAKDAAFEEAEREAKETAVTAREEVDAGDKALLAELFGLKDKEAKS